MGFNAPQQQTGFDVNALFTLVNNETTNVMNQINSMQANSSNISIGAMFQMQMTMNHLSQMSEAASNVVSASNAAISSMARNVK